jgi:hypothetical protein
MSTLLLPGFRIVGQEYGAVCLIWFIELLWRPWRDMVAGTR